MWKLVVLTMKIVGDVSLESHANHRNIYKASWTENKLDTSYSIENNKNWENSSASVETSTLNRKFSP